MSDRLLLSQAEAADALGVSPKTLRDQVKAGKLRFIQIGKRRKFCRQDLDEFISNGRVTWPSNGGQGRQTGTTTSRSEVVGFEEAVERLKGKRQPSSKGN